MSTSIIPKSVDKEIEEKYPYSDVLDVDLRRLKQKYNEAARDGVGIALGGWHSLDVAPIRLSEEEDVEVLALDDIGKIHMITYNFGEILGGFIWGGFHIQIIGWRHIGC